MVTYLYDKDDTLRRLYQTIIQSWKDVAPTIHCQTFTAVRLYENGDGVYIDDEGLYVEDQWFWIHRNYPQPLAGKALFIGLDIETGEDRDLQTDIQEIRKDIRFIGDAHEIRILHLVKKDIEDYRPYFFNDLEAA